MLKGLWNFAIKVKDLEKAVGFYTGVLDGQVRLKGEVLGSQYVLIRLGDCRVILFDKAPYEKDHGLNLPPGLLHVVYEVDDFDAYLKRLRGSGVKFLTEPTVIKGEFGTRRIVFFEAPDGVRTEVMEVLEDSGKA